MLRKLGSRLRRRLPITTRRLHPEDEEIIERMRRQIRLLRLIGLRRGRVPNAGTRASPYCRHHQHEITGVEYLVAHGCLGERGRICPTNPGAPCGRRGLFGIRMCCGELRFLFPREEDGSDIRNSIRLDGNFGWRHRDLW